VVQIRFGRINPKKIFVYYNLPEWTVSMWRFFYNLDFNLSDLKLRIITSDNTLLLEKQLQSPTGLFFFNCNLPGELIFEYYFKNHKLLSLTSAIDRKLIDDKIYFTSGGWSGRTAGETR